MITFVLAFILFLSVTAAMAVGYLLQKKKLRGSCGSIASLGLGKDCDCVNACEQPTHAPSNDKRSIPPYET